MKIDGYCKQTLKESAFCSDKSKEAEIEINDRKLLFDHETLNPVGHQSTNWMDRLVLMEAMAALTSLGTTSPRYNMQQAMYFP